MRILTLKQAYELTRRSDVNSSLRSHAFDVLPEVVEALKDLIAYNDGFTQRGDLKDVKKQARNALAKADRVVVE